MAESAWVSVSLAAVAGLAVSIGIERLMVPRPLFSRPAGCWALHCGLWLLVYGLLVLISGRPWFAAAGVSAFMLLLVMVSNAKMKSLREPFVFQDYEYFIDAIRHPRLYIPFLGWGKALAASLAFLLAVATGFGLETVPAQRFYVSGQLGGVVVVLTTGLLLIAVGSGQQLPVTFKPEHDLPALGFLTSLWRYAVEGQKPPTVVSPFNFLLPTGETANLPHLVAVQSESFFDPRTLYSGIRQDVLAQFDQIKTSAIAHGKLFVPAWGANTVRSEFAFLSGLDEAMLGVHRFNPYQAVVADWDVPSLASFLKQLGYRTVCIHPYPASFYQRFRVYPRMGFDEFLDIRVFSEAACFGAYVSDAAVAEKVSEVLDQAAGPTFIFVITMENHGPLHLEQVKPTDIDDFYSTQPPDGCEDLTIYLRHLRNADRMIGVLETKLESCGRPAGLCWFGDHVPIMPSVYEALGTPKGETDFLLWSNGDQCIKGEGDETLSAHHLAIRWLRAMKLIEN